MSNNKLADGIQGYILDNIDFSVANMNDADTPVNVWFYFLNWFFHQKTLRRKNYDVVFKDWLCGLPAVFEIEMYHDQQRIILNSIGCKLAPEFPDKQIHDLFLHAIWGQFFRMVNETYKEVNLIVGNVGRVECAGITTGYMNYLEYVSQSKNGYGRAAGESVLLFADGEVIKEYNPE